MPMPTKLKTDDRFMDCAAQHFGLWAVLPTWLQSHVAAYNAGTLPKVVTEGKDSWGRPIPLYEVDGNGVVTVPINGPLTKGQSSFGGTSSVRVRRILRVAEADEDVKGFMLLIDSPGGTMAGQQAMADEVYRIAKAGQKPIVAHAEDLMASAAMWLGAQASHVSASAMTEVGSIGTFRVLYDTSGAAEQDGIKVHVVSSAPFKGEGMPGTPVTDDMLERAQADVNAVNEFFLSAMRRGRGLSAKQVEDVATGQTWLAGQAKELGLIDAVMSQDAAYSNLLKMIKQAGKHSRLAAAEQRTRMLEM